MLNRVNRVNVGIMMAGQGRVADVFDATASFLKERKRKEEAQLRAKRTYSPAQEEARRYAAGSVDFSVPRAAAGGVCRAAGSVELSVPHAAGIWCLPCHCLLGLCWFACHMLAGVVG